MDELIQIQLGEFKNINSVNVDSTIKINLSQLKDLLIENDINKTVDVSEVFEIERQNTEVYRIYGEIEYLSILNGLIPTYTSLADFFTRQPLSVTTKDILTDLTFYLIKPLPPSGTTLLDGVTESTGYVSLSVKSTGGTYIKNFEVMSKLNNFEIFKAGFSQNLFGEQLYAFDFNIDFNLTDVYDAFNFPLDELYLYALYNPTKNKADETIARKTFDSSGFNGPLVEFQPTQLNIGDIIDGPVIKYRKDLFTQTIENSMEYFIKTKYDLNMLMWKYSPIIPIKIRQFSDDLQQVNISGDSVLDIASIPTYATLIDNDGNYVWRNLLNRGFIDPLTENGVNYPFMNNRHYVFNKIMVDIRPNDGQGVYFDPNTNLVFSKINFNANTFIGTKPNGDLTKIGEIC